MEKIDNETAEKIRNFVVLIAHGDDDHRLWLRNAGEAFIKGEPIPRPQTSK